YGVATGRFVFAPLMRQTGQRVLIGTIALAIALQEFLRLAQGSRLTWVQPMLNAPYAVARAGDFVVTVTPMALGAALLCLVAALAGGIGSVPGAFLGGILLGCAEALWSALFPIEFRDLAIFTLLVVLLVVRPSGLFGFVEPLPRKL